MKTKTHIARIFGVIPAAGHGRRMNAAKQSLPLGDTTVTACVAHTMLCANLDAVVVVTRTELREALRLPNHPRLQMVFNDDPAAQMIDSIRLAIAHLEHAPHPARAHFERGGILVVPADMPAVSLLAYEASIRAFRENPARIIIATHQGRRGHPIIFPANRRAELYQLEGGLNELPRRHPRRVITVPIDDSTVLRDIDTPADYRNLLGSPASPTGGTKRTSTLVR